ncbi:hypothetical protein [Nonlabens sp. Asnod3-A02]|uniref:hypothetical protein n=1 Tax=Nonlabens sp. Asnod3-A02 TaxID=3160579 RepID=UPI00387016A4
MKKIIKYFKYLFLTIVTILLIFVLSIGLTNHELKGTWIGEYEVHPDMDLYLPHERVMTLGYFSCVEEVPKYYGTSSIDNPDIITSERIGFVLNMFDVIKSNNFNKYEVISINKDSLQVKSTDFNKTKYQTFRRINDSLKNNQKINLAGKRFLLSDSKGTDTIHFKKDGRYEYTTDNNKFQIWDLAQHNGFQILFLVDIPPFVITHKEGNVIELKRIQYPSLNFKMTEIVE